MGVDGDLCIFFIKKRESSTERQCGRFKNACSLFQNLVIIAHSYLNVIT